MLKRLATVAATAALIVGVPAAAHADPTKGDLITLDCDNGETYEIIAFSNGAWSPGLLTEGNGVLRPVALDITGTFTPVGGEPEEVFSESTSKNVGAKTETTGCTFTETSTDDTGTFVIDGSVTIVLPRG
jgi:hypothetical protein